MPVLVLVLVPVLVLALVPVPVLVLVLVLVPVLVLVLVLVLALVLAHQHRQKPTGCWRCANVIGIGTSRKQLGLQAMQGKQTQRNDSSACVACTRSLRSSKRVAAHWRRSL